jgi:hypothetical protein
MLTVLGRGARLPAQERPQEPKPPVFRRTKRMKFNRPDGASFEMDCPSVDFKSADMPWQVIYLENGDELWWKFTITEAYDTLQIVEGDPIYHFKYQLSTRVVPLGGSRTPGVAVGLGEHITTDERQGPGDADDGG